MTLGQYIARCKLAVHTNFKARNVRVFGTDLRQKRIKVERCNEIRRWVSELRLATNSVSAPLVAERVRWSVN